MHPGCCCSARLPSPPLSLSLSLSLSLYLFFFDRQLIRPLQSLHEGLQSFRTHFLLYHVLAKLNILGLECLQIYARSGADKVPPLEQRDLTRKEGVTA